MSRQADAANDSGAITQLWEKIDQLDEASDQCFEHFEREINYLRHQLNELRAMMPKAGKAVRKRKRNV
jgi:DNA repair ATPase RecN